MSAAQISPDALPGNAFSRWLNATLAYPYRAWRGCVSLDRVDAASCVIVAFIGLLDIFWSWCVPFRLPMPGAPLLCGAILGVVALIYSTAQSDIHIANYACCAALWLTFPELGARLTYLAASLAAPLQDDLFARLDSALGFDWTGYLQLATCTKWMADLLSAGYMSYFVQPALSMLAFMAMGDTRRNSDLLNAILVAFVVTVAVSAVVPAYGAGQHYGVFPPKPESIDLQRLRSGAAGSFVALNGIVTFPSFHTVMLVLIVHAHRGRWSFWPFVCINALMLLSVPAVGGHYAVDVLAGGTVAMGSILANQLIRLHGSRGEVDEYATV